MDDPLILSFDTSAAHCAAALLRGDRVLVSVTEPMDKGQAERLMPLLAEVLASAGAGWADLQALAVGTGPGNFTGVRIAVAAARGLALALEVPAIGVTRFDAAALGLPRPVAVVQDARRGEVYLQLFGNACSPARVMTAEAAAAMLGGMALTGDAAEVMAAITGGTVLAPAQPLAEAMARVALGRLDDRQPRPAPFYLRGADAAPPSDPPPVILP